MTTPRELEDKERVRAVRERERNVVVDASAGTGKTRLVVERIVEMLAPSDGFDPIPIERIAAITFTRKAAGELRLRTRQTILQKLASLPHGAPQVPALRAALGGIDTATIGTIHGFSDRLLRRFPSRARLDPLYALVEETEELVQECFELLIHAADEGTLGELLGGEAVDPARCIEAAATLSDMQRAGLRLRSLETENWTYHGLDNLIGGFVVARDIDSAEPALVDFDRSAFDRFTAEYVALVSGMSSATPGGRWLVENGQLLRRVATEQDPAVLFRELVERFERGPHRRASDAPSRAVDFDGDDRAWDAWKAFAGDARAEPVRASPLRDDLLGPLRAWIAVRLARLRPIVLRVYDGVKARHRVVDHLDLLIRLRDLLRDDRAIRRSCQELFDHIFVDEFQDTDPLQAEIVLFLCERGAVASTWDAVALAPGKLTVVGDPKQSIYRFRRADITTYQKVVEIVARSPHRAVRLSSSFRSAPMLVDWLNTRFATILGVDGVRGDVAYHALSHGRVPGPTQTVHVVPMDLPEGGGVAECRGLEAKTMARYVRWLVEKSDVETFDRWTEQPRRIGYGDIGVLAITTTNLRVLFDAFDLDDVPYAARGGALFLGDPLHRRFLLGLCALADRDDGVALAAVLRPPFFAVGLGDLARTRADDPEDRAVQARAIVTELRRRRFERSPGATARALLEETGLGRMVALGPNGSQRLAGLRELCFQLELRALDEELDFDAVVERVRRWIDSPRRLERPHPVTEDAVRVMTVHQAKGLEFAVVVLWDGRALWRERTTYDAWTVERDGRAWAMRLDHLHWESEQALDIVARERAMREAERKRLVYVAATRARDILVIPKVGVADDRWILSRLLGTARSATVIERALNTAEHPADWFTSAGPGDKVARIGQTDIEEALVRGWGERVAEVSVARFAASTFSQKQSKAALWGKRGRFGPVFGEAVHLAIGIAMTGGIEGSEAVRRVAARVGLTAHHVEAAADVERAVEALRALGVGTSACRLEYPIAGVGVGGTLAAGYIDLVAELPMGLILLDFKTDSPPGFGEEVSSGYVEQVRGYTRALEAALGRPTAQAGLLYTADGVIRWLSSDDKGVS